MPKETRPPVPEPSKASGAKKCVNCSHPLGDGDYCPACGQRQRSGRLTFQGIARRAVADGFSLDRGFFYTLVALTRRPGEVAKDFVAGRTAPYTSPIRYFLVCLAVAQLVAFWTEAIQGFVEGFTEGNRDVSLNAKEGSKLLGDYFVLMAAGVLPLVVFATRLLLRRARFNIAEHMVFHLYTAGHSALCLAVGLVSAKLLPDPAEGFVVVVVLLAMLVNYVASVRAFFEISKLRAVLVTALAFGLGGLAYTLLMSMVLVSGNPSP